MKFSKFSGKNKKILSCSLSKISIRKIDYHRRLKRYPANLPPGCNCPANSNATTKRFLSVIYNTTTYFNT